MSVVEPRPDNLLKKIPGSSPRMTHFVPENDTFCVKKKSNLDLLNSIESWVKDEKIYSTILFFCRFLDYIYYRAVNDICVGGKI